MRAAQPALRMEQSPRPHSRAPAAGPRPTLSPVVRTSTTSLADRTLIYIIGFTTIMTSSFLCNDPHKELYFTELNVPFKKRHARYVPGATPALSDHLLRPLSPITPPLPEEGLHPLLHGPHGSLLTNGLAYSPLPSLPVGCCNTTLQFEVSSWVLRYTLILRVRVRDCPIINWIQPCSDSCRLFFPFCRTYRHRRPHQFTSPSLLRFVFRPQLLSEEHDLSDCLTLCLCPPLLLSPDGPGWSQASSVL